MWVVDLFFVVERLFLSFCMCEQSSLPNISSYGPIQEQAEMVPELCLFNLEYLQPRMYMGWHCTNDEAHP